MTSKVVSEIDFDTIKESFKQYLQSQSEFSDYNLEGSNFNIILDMLAYNTYYNAMYQNLAISEVFLDSAVKRGSVVSRAKELGYLPRSTTASEVEVNIVCTSLEPDEIAPSMTLSRGTRFRGIDANNTDSYYFVVTESVTSNINSNTFTFSNVKLKEGSLVSYSFRVDLTDNPNLIFEIPHDNIDINTIRVRVQESIGSPTIETFIHARESYDIDGTSKVFYVQENYREKYEIQFGDGNLGKKLSTGNIVLVDYLMTNGSAANGISRIKAVDPVGLVSIDRVIITTLNESANGGSKESAESIRLNAPIYHIAHGKAITNNDYQSFLKNKFSFIEAINTWGGEENDPPLYGRECICIKPTNGLFLSDFLKYSVIKPELRKSANVSIMPEFIDPTFKYVSLEVDIKYDETQTLNQSNTIKNLALTKIDNYFAKVSNKFETNFIKSALITDLNTIDTSIKSIVVNLFQTLKFLIIPEATQSISLNFNSSIVPYSFSSNLITVEVNQVSYDVFIKDKSTDFKSSNGTINAIDENGNIIINNLGTINYITGTVELNNMTILSSKTNDNNILFNAKSVDDIEITKNQLILKDPLLYGQFDGVISGVRVTVTEI